jgi:hypothetical protein
MKRRVTVKDDAYRVNVCRWVSTADLVKTGGVKRYMLRGGKLPNHLLVPLVDQRGHRLQEKYHVEHVFEGDRLDRAVRRARRWLRSRRARLGGGAPGHITLAMAAFHMADPDAFKAEALPCSPCLT